MRLWTALIVFTVLFVVLAFRTVREHVAPEKIRWYDLFVFVAFYFVIFGIDSWVMPLGGLGHLAYLFGVGWYAIDVIDSRPMPKRN